MNKKKPWLLVRGLILGISLAVVGCGVQNNASFTTQQGNCPDGTNNAPYCMAVTLQNNNGGQNYISSTNYPFSNLSLTVSGASNIGYPTTSGSSYDPNNCLGASIAPGASCTFYLKLTAESFPVGSKMPITVTANYTINNSWIGDSTASGSASVTLYQVPTLIMSSNTGSAINYSSSGLSTAYRTESGEVVANSVTNDNSYGFLYTAGNLGIYYANLGGYVGNATAESSNIISGANNVLVSGNTLYASSLGNNGYLYYSTFSQLNFNWTQFVATTSAFTFANNIIAVGAGSIFLAASGAATVYNCSNSGSVSGNTCAAEANSLNNFSGVNTITAVAYLPLGTSSDNTALTGLVVGTNNGLYAESGAGQPGYPQLGWESVTTSNQSLGPITALTNDASQNLYIANNANNVYKLTANGSNQAVYLLSLGVVVPNQIVALVYDNAAAAIYAAISNGDVYKCTSLSSNPSCSNLVNTGFGSNLFGLNIVTSLSSS